jgi:hypothetical protein
MKRSDLLLGLYQVLGGLFTGYSLFATMLHRHWSAVGFLLLFSALSVGTGALHLLSHPKRYELSILNQLTQVVGFYSAWITVAVMHGGAVKVSLLLDWKESFAKSTFNLSAAAGFFDSLCDVDLFGTLPTLHSFSLSLNFLALGLLIYCVRQRRKIMRANA